MNLKVISKVEAVNEPDLSSAADWFIRNIIGLNNQEVLELSEDVVTADDNTEKRIDEKASNKKRK